MLHWLSVTQLLEDIPALQKIMMYKCPKLCRYTVEKEKKGLLEECGWEGGGMNGETCLQEAFVAVKGPDKCSSLPSAHNLGSSF